MKYRVHLYATFRLAVEVDAKNPKTAIGAAMEKVEDDMEGIARQVSPPRGIQCFDWAEEFSAALVDEPNDPDFKKSQSFRLVAPNKHEKLLRGALK